MIGHHFYFFFFFCRIHFLWLSILRFNNTKEFRFPLSMLSHILINLFYHFTSYMRFVLILCHSNFKTFPLKQPDISIWITLLCWTSRQSIISNNKDSSTHTIRLLSKVKPMISIELQEQRQAFHSELTNPFAYDIWPHDKNEQTSGFPWFMSIQKKWTWQLLQGEFRKKRLLPYFCQ